jgi:hypothetical protein
MNPSRNPFGQVNQKGPCLCSPIYGCGKTFPSLKEFDRHLQGPDRVCNDEDFEQRGVERAPD